jgi:hypothetical protein
MTCFCSFDSLVMLSPAPKLQVDELQHALRSTKIQNQLKGGDRRAAEEVAAAKAEAEELRKASARSKGTLHLSAGLICRAPFRWSRAVAGQRQGTHTRPAARYSLPVFVQSIKQEQATGQQVVEDLQRVEKRRVVRWRGARREGDKIVVCANYRYDVTG